MKSSNMLRLVAAGGILCAIPANATELGPGAKGALADMKPAERQKVLEFEQSLHPSGGTVVVPRGHAALAMGEDYYFLPAADAKRILVEAWGNPPDSVGDVLGMVFPNGRHFYDGVWGAVLTYDDSGH